jgi:uncharacterized glyoxalase superfamily protein PhnB
MTNTEDPPTLGEYNGHEIYPMPAFATLAVRNVAAVAGWYERALGFTTVFKGHDAGGEPALVHLRRLKYQDLLLTIASSESTPAEAPSSLTLSFSVGDEVDALAVRARSVEPLGRSVIVGPVDTSWNTRDLRVTDPAGHRLIFTGRNPNPDPAQQARMRDMFDRQRGT